MKKGGRYLSTVHPSVFLCKCVYILSYVPLWKKNNDDINDDEKRSKKKLEEREINDGREITNLSDLR